MIVSAVVRRYCPHGLIQGTFDLKITLVKIKTQFFKYQSRERIHKDGGVVLAHPPHGPVCN